MIMTIIYGIIFLIEALIAFQYFEWMFGNPRYSVRKRLVAVLIGYTILFVFFQFHVLIFNMIAFPVVNFVVIKKVYKQHALPSFFQSVAMTVIMTLTEMIVTAAFSGISKKSWEPSKGVLMVLFMAIISKFIYFLIMFIISRYRAKQRKNVQMGITGWSVLAIPFCVMLVVFLLNYMCFFSHTNKMQEQVVMSCSIICLIIIVISFVIYGYLERVHQDNLDKTLQIQREECDCEYYKVLIKQEESQKILIHDIKKHINSIRDLIVDQDYETAQKYMERLYSSRELKETIKFSDNSMVNVILNRYSTRFIEAGIRYDFDIRRESMDFVQIDDITVLLCNMLDNAYEGMNRIENAYVELRICMQGNGMGALITMINDCTPAAATLVSNKKDKRFHGYGIKSMQRVAEKYNGSVELYYSEEDKRFHTVIFLEKN
ncbi:MAG: GHKL domain-containing protein [Coprococcus sp.]|nr:GHKL domain-containing protein [Coprococcus sp.]